MCLNGVFCDEKSLCFGFLVCVVRRCCFSLAYFVYSDWFAYEFFCCVVKKTLFWDIRTIYFHVLLFYVRIFCEISNNLWVFLPSYFFNICSFVYFTQIICVYLIKYYLFSVYFIFILFFSNIFYF